MLIQHHISMVSHASEVSSTLSSGCDYITSSTAQCAVVCVQ